MQLKVTVNRLNKRIRIPAQLPESSGIIGQVLLGYTFEGVEAPASEIKNQALGKWYVDRDGYYYWGGGVIGMPGIEEAIIAPALKAVPKGVGVGGATPLEIIVQNNYNTLIQNLPEEWRLTHGKNIKIAVLDSGFISHQDLKNNIIETFNAVDNSNDVRPIGSDDINHGNNVAGLVAASSIFTDGVMGVAPEAKIIAVKISNNGHIDCKDVLNGLDFAINKTDASIINLSFSIDDGEYTPFQDDFLTLFKKAENKGVIVIASGGDNSRILSNRKNLLQPANEEFCLSVGTINQTFIQNNPNPSYHSRLDYIIPQQFLKSCAGSENTYSTISNCSMAAGILSGTAALLYSHNTGFPDKQTFIEEFNKPFEKISSTISFQLSIYKV